MARTSPLLVQMRSRLAEPPPVRFVYDDGQAVSVDRSDRATPAVLLPDGESWVKTLERATPGGEDLARGLS